MSSIHPDKPVGAYYNVKDQPLPGHSSYNRGNRRRSGGRRRPSACCCCAWLCSILVTLIVTIGIIVLVFWLVVRPKTPRYNVTDVRINGLSNNTAVTLGTPVVVNTSYTVEAKNPNKRISIYYDDFDVKLETSGVDIGEGTIPAFKQGHRNTTYITDVLTSSPLNVTQLQSAGVIDNVQDGKVPLYLTVDVKVRVEVGSWKLPRTKFNVRCNIDIDPLRTSNQVLDRSCKVKWKR